MSTKNIVVVTLWILLLTGCGAQENTSPTPKAVVSENLPTVTVPTSNTGTVSDIAVAGSGAKVIPNPEEHPKFDELKKKQALLSDKIDGIKDPQYLKLNKDLFELFEAKEIWPDELKKLDAEFSDVMAQGGKVQTGSSVDFENAFKKRNDALKVFQASQAYKDYMVSKKEKLDSLAAKQAKYMTPEIINLKQEIDSLGTEVYSTTPR